MAPIICSALKHLPVHRERMFFGNVPHLVENRFRREELTNLRLQDFLMPGRKANHQIAKTITTNPSNQIRNVKFSPTFA